MYQDTSNAGPVPDEEGLIHTFQTGHPPHGVFRHADHVRTAWAYLHKWPFAEALARFSVDLQRFATAHGKPNLYHATVTTAYMAIIAERMDRVADATWEAFAEENPDLLRWKDGALFDYYDPSILEDETARRTFVLPLPVGRNRADALVRG